MNPTPIGLGWNQTLLFVQPGSGESGGPTVANEIQKVEVIEINPTKRYSNDDFWRKLNRFARKAGREVVEKALWLYYAMQRPETPAWARRTIIGALVYFLLPFDLVADLAPLVGFTDDLSVLLLAVSTVAAYITPTVREEARLKAKEWFGETELHTSPL
jgi:uncharacterized membrane protein YkvA (DUF1232 family)